MQKLISTASHYKHIECEQLIDYEDVLLFQLQSMLYNKASLLLAYKLKLCLPYIDIVVTSYYLLVKFRFI